MVSAREGRRRPVSRIRAMKGNSNRTTLQPAAASPLAMAAMNGLSIGALAPWASSTVAGASSGPSINGGAEGQSLTPPRVLPRG
jgi:hypothetical protein